MTIVELRRTLAGSLVTADDDEWDAARLFHSGIGEPDLIVRAATVDDVRAAVRHASADQQPVMVRSGGHSAWGEVHGGVTIDIAALHDVAVDGETVRIGGGATWGHVAATLAEHGLGISSGDTASVGVGGLTLGGGIGWMVRAWGLACDQLVGVQLVTAGAEVVEATDASHPDLMWALRGGGGNFGVVTRFDFRAHRLPAVVFTTLGVSGDARPALRALRDVMASAPRKLTVTYTDEPAMEPDAPGGATVTACWIGDDADASRRVLAPLRAVPGVSVIGSGVQPYPGILLDAPTYNPDEPMPGFLGGNTLLRDLSDEVIDALAAFRESSEVAILLLRSLGGAFADVTQVDSAFPARDATWFACAAAFDFPGMITDAARDQLRAAWEAIEEQGAGVYGNFTESTDAAYVTKMYPPATMARLASIKRAWDPSNVFARNHNVVPVEAG